MNILTIFFITFAILVVLRFPLYLSLIGSSAVYIFLNPNLDILTAMEKMLNATNSFPLVAVPFFLFAGQIMNSGGVTTRIFDFSKKLVGHLRGGLAYVNVLASLIFSGISGSALADVGGLGMIEIKAMREDGYEDDLILGITAASSTIGPIIPPSIPFVLYGAMANVSIGGLFLGGIGPGIVIALILCSVIYFIAKKRNYPIRKRATLKEILISFKEAFFALCFPLIILGGLWSGAFTPTEAAFVSVLYGMIISVFIYKSFSIKEIPRITIETIKTVGPALAVVVGASLFAWIMTYEKMDQIFLEFIFSITYNKYIILLLMNFLLLILGMFIDITPAIMMTLPILGPLVAIIGMNPIHFGVIMVLNLMIGLLTPPVGFSLYMLSSVSGHSFSKVMRMVTPWVIPLFIAQLIITFIPEIVMFIPNLFGIH